MSAAGENTRLFGCVLIGGQSRRMGRPKHLLTGPDGRSWLEIAASRLAPFVDTVVISGEGDVPPEVRHLERVSDITGVVGPLSGIGAVLRSHPLVSWLVLACDMPEVTDPCVQWLLAQRRPGAAAVIPKHPDSGRSEPLFAWYGTASRELTDRLIASGMPRISAICNNDQVHQPLIPAELCNCWRNVNSERELEALQSSPNISRKDRKNCF